MSKKVNAPIGHWDLVPTGIVHKPPLTICFFPDGSMVTASCMKEDEYSEEYGVMACITKKVFATRGYFKKTLRDATYRQPKLK